MTSGARGNVVRDGEVATYHAYNSATRQLFEFGPDPLKGVDYSYRRQWIHKLHMNMASLFAIDIGFHAEMANHYHIIVRTRPDVVEHWSDDDVVRRWLTICKLKRTPADELTWPTQEEVEREFKKPGRISTLRKRLSKLSWFMGIPGGPLHPARSNRDPFASLTPAADPRVPSTRSLATRCLAHAIHSIQYSYISIACR